MNITHQEQKYVLEFLLKDCVDYELDSFKRYSQEGCDKFDFWKDKAEINKNIILKYNPICKECTNLNKKENKIYISEYGICKCLYYHINYDVIKVVNYNIKLYQIF
jgi:hypothetical protein